MRKNTDAYTAAGVNRDMAGEAKDRIKIHARTTFNSRVLTDIGPFAGLFHLTGHVDPIIVSSMDGVGTKIKIAVALNKHNTVGMDIVNHSINDILTCGAEPLFFLDYIAMGKLDAIKTEQIAIGLAKACKDAGVALIGGETAEMPGVYGEQDYDLAGCIIGVVDQNKIINGSKIKIGDTIIGIPSSGLHTNGYSLARKLFTTEYSALNVYYPDLGRTIGEVLMEPHRCYYRIIKPVLPIIKGMAHITGGGLLENVPRVLPKGISAHFRIGSWEILPIFKLIQSKGKIANNEMYHVFNMGIGMVIFCNKTNARRILKAIPDSKIIGETEKLAGKPVILD